MAIAIGSCHGCPTLMAIATDPRHRRISVMAIAMSFEIDFSALMAVTMSSCGQGIVTDQANVSPDSKPSAKTGRANRCP